MGPKLSRILVILWLLRQEFAQKEIGWFKYQLISILLCQKRIIDLMLKKPSGLNGKLVLAENKHKNTTRTNSAEMSKIVSNSEIHLHHCLCESRGFKIGRSNHRRCSVKKVFLKILQNWQKITCLRVLHGFSTVSFTKFLRTLPGDCFWWRRLMVKNLNYVSLIFLNPQLCHTPAEWWLLFWCNEEHFFTEKTWLNIS